MTKILPHYNCLQGEHVFIPNQTYTDTRNTRIESFVCTHCLVVVNKNEWQIHQQELKRMAESMEFPSVNEDLKKSQMLASTATAPYIPHDYKEPLKEAAKSAPKPATKAAPKKV